MKKQTHNSKIFFLLLLICVTLINCSSSPKKIQERLDAGETPLEIVMSGVEVKELYGKMYEGGLIFYLNTTDGTGMVAATEDQSIGTEWGCLETDVMNINNVQSCPGMANCDQPAPEETVEGAMIGYGKRNTKAILVECKERGIAAKLCRDLGADWFLPSRGELNLMYTNLHAKGDGEFAKGDGTIASVSYYSSTEGNINLAWSQNFDNGNQYGINKDYKGYVRAVRAF